METVVDFDALEGAFRRNTGGGTVGTGFASRQPICRRKMVLEILFCSWRFEKAEQNAGVSSVGGMQRGGM